MKKCEQVEFGFAGSMFNLCGDEDKRRARRTRAAEERFTASEEERRKSDREWSLKLAPVLGFFRENDVDVK